MMSDLLSYCAGIAVTIIIAVVLGIWSDDPLSNQSELENRVQVLEKDLRDIKQERDELGKVLNKKIQEGRVK